MCIHGGVEVVSSYVSVGSVRVWGEEVSTSECDA